MSSSVCKGSPCPLHNMTSRGQAPPKPDKDSKCLLTPIIPNLLLSLSLSPWVYIFCLSFGVMLLHSSLHSADTFTTFWWAEPMGRWASPSGVITGGVGMLMIAVVIWLLWQFRGAGSSTRMFRLERLRQEKQWRRFRIVCTCRNILESLAPFPFSC